MSTKYLCPRGTVVNHTNANQSGIYAVEGLENKKGDYPLLISSIAYNKEDVLLTVACLNNVKVIYSFGEDFGSVAIAGKILLGPISTGAKTEHLKGLVNWFQKRRSSRSTRPVQASILDLGAIRFYVHGLRIGEPDAELHVQPFLITGILVE